MPDKAILFDWGGTLMVTMPHYLGADAGWSKVDMVPHAEEVVKQLAESWTIGLASNASESGEEQIRESLDSIGLGQVFEHIYTYRRVGRPKPWAEFWGYILRDLGFKPEQVVMVGDDYMSDVWGASQVGMFAVWLNLRNGEQKQGERVATIHNLRDLSQVLNHWGF